MAGVGRASLAQRNQRRERMRFDGRAVGRADLNIDAYHPSFAHGLAEGRVKDERSTMRDARFDNHVGLHGPKNLLGPDHVLGQLDDRPAKPAKGVRIFLVPTDLKPEVRDQLKAFRGVVE